MSLWQFRDTGSSDTLFQCDAVFLYQTFEASELSGTQSMSGLSSLPPQEKLCPGEILPQEPKCWGWSSGGQSAEGLARLAEWQSLHNALRW